MLFSFTTHPHIQTNVYTTAPKPHDHATRLGSATSSSSLNTFSFESPLSLLLGCGPPLPSGVCRRCSRYIFSRSWRTSASFWSQKV